MARKNRLPSLGGCPTPGSRIRRGEGFEIFHQPSVTACRFWYFVRRIGKAIVSPSFRCEHHGIDGFLLHFKRKGRLWHRIQNRTHVVQRGDACLMDLSDDVFYGVDGPGKAEFYWVLFSGRDMRALFLELRADRAPVFPKTDRARMESLFRELISITEHQPPAYEMKMGSLLIALLAELSAGRNPPVSLAALAAQDRPLSPAVRKAIDRYSAYYYIPTLSVKQLATQLHQNMHYFIRRFHQEVGMSPKAYLNQYRIEQAQLQLQASDKTIEQIARSVGFPDQNFFTRQFTKIVKIPPSEYRRVHQTRH